MRAYRLFAPKVRPPGNRARLDDAGRPTFQLRFAESGEDREAMQALADLSLEYGVLSAPVDMDSFMP